MPTFNENIDFEPANHSYINKQSNPDGQSNKIVLKGADATAVGTVGGTIEEYPGKGLDATDTEPGTDGGVMAEWSGFGGDGSATQPAGNGGTFQSQSGDAGADNGGGGGDGGAWVGLGGRGTGDGDGGDYIIDGGPKGTGGAGENGYVKVGRDYADEVQIGRAGKVVQVYGLLKPNGLILNRVAVDDANYSLQASDYLAAYTALTNERVVGLPEVGTVPVGATFIVKDESGNAGSGLAQITIAVAYGGNIDGQSQVHITTPYGSLAFYYNGTDYSTLP